MLEGAKTLHFCVSSADFLSVTEIVQLIKAFNQNPENEVLQEKVVKVTDLLIDEDPDFDFWTVELMSN